MKKPKERKYLVEDVIVFQKNEDAFGDLSNMASRFPIVVNGIEIRTVEALYQACRYPEHPDAQREIIEQKSPMAAKYKSRGHQAKTRADWDDVKVNVMRWCLRVKLAQHWDAFSSILLATGEKPIVEQSKIDPFWGAKLQDDSTLQGCNVLGRLMMELRESIKQNDKSPYLEVSPPSIPSFNLYGEPVRKVYAVDYQPNESPKPAKPQKSQPQLPF